MHITRISTHGDHTFTLTTPGSYTYFVNNVNGSLSIDIQAEDIHVSILGLYTGKQDQCLDQETGVMDLLIVVTSLLQQMKRFLTGTSLIESE